jgi:uncharacterized protein (DUF952 family)
VSVIFHIASKADWLAAQGAGEYRGSTRDRTLDEEGFIHCSTADQVTRIANDFYSDAEVDLAVLEIAPERLDAEVRYENLDGGAELFPHIYGALPVDGVVSVTPLARDSSGTFVFHEPAR